jgi:hypothetical protein
VPLPLPRPLPDGGVVEMDQWEDLDLLEPAHITFIGKDSGEPAVVAVAADLDVRYGSRNGSACVVFSWEGSDDNSMPADAVGPRSALLICINSDLI